ncbi:MAG TPA: UDP-N-acetylglucosamine 4,6-dehydratase [Cyclobacteriaceae bacterium]|nr:UDP-N-acetylglucosamine 4,6-dehydratase [Cyclobacteriaceae bacterium]
MMIDELNLIGRSQKLFSYDLEKNKLELENRIRGSNFLVIGGAGTIGQAVSKEIFKRRPKALHIVDISENNLVELVRDIRSSFGYITGDFRTLPLDCGSLEYDAFIEQSSVRYDYILNLSALKHVRSEKDPFSLMRMINVNILNTEKTLKQAIEFGAEKYFCVSTDKAANPINMMGASKRIMELFLMRRSLEIRSSTARFANVAFSDGSLLHGFVQRLNKKQPIAAPNDIKRYFITFQESGELCLLSCLLGDNRDIFFPKLNEELNLLTFSEIAIRFLETQGYEPFFCDTEDEARNRVSELVLQKKWPCYFFKSDTTGEKDFEEFYTAAETLDLNKFQDVGIVKNELTFDSSQLKYFEAEIRRIKTLPVWNKENFVDLFKFLLPDFHHEEKGKNLDNKM